MYEIESRVLNGTMMTGEHVCICSPTGIGSWFFPSKQIIVTPRLAADNVCLKALPANEEIDFKKNLLKSKTCENITRYEFRHFAISI